MRNRLLAALAATLLLAAGCGTGDEGTPDSTTGVVTATSRATTTTTAPAVPATSTTGTSAPTTVTPGSQPLADVSVRLTRMADLGQSTTVLAARPGTDTLYVAEQRGLVRALLVADDEATVIDTPVLDLRSDISADGERGLLGLAFSADGGTLYASYTNSDGDTRVDAYAMDGDVADPGSRRQIFAADQPHSNHNGGAIHLGPDGRLWLGLGDGGSQGDPDNRAQDLSSPLGKMLRIDPSAPDPAEIWALGLRNPWRFSFDPDTGDLWIADVGAGDVEEVDVVPAGTPPGTNFGWSGMEGTRTNDESRVPAEHVAPVAEMTHDDGWCSIIGGVVYRGARIPALDGAYLFGDHCRPQVLGLRLADGAVAEQVELGVDVASLTSIDTDGHGEVWLLTLDGPVYRLDPA